MRFSRRTPDDRADNPLSRAVAARHHRGEAIVDLTISNPTIAGFDYDPRTVLSPLTDSAGLTYRPDPFGLRSAREALAAELSNGGAAIDPEHLVLTASTSEAYAMAFALFCDPGDRVLAPRPSYPLFATLAAYTGVELDSYRLAYDGSWHLDAPSLHAARTPRSRAVLAVSPNNPTGSYLSDDERDACHATGLPLVCDEVFRRYPLRGAPPATPAAPPVLTLTLGGLSKDAGLPQLKLSWIHVTGPAALVEEALSRLSILADAFLSVSTPVQLALPALLEAARPIRRQIHDRIRDNRALLEQSIGAGSAVTLLDARAGWYSIVRVPSTQTDESWALQLLNERGVLMQPGYLYDLDGGAFLVVSLLTPPTELARGLAELLELVDG